MSLLSKLFLSFTLCVTFIIGLLSYLYYQQISDVIWERNREATGQMLFRFGSSVDRIYKDIDRISAQILYDPEINAFFNGPEPRFDNSYETFVRINKLTTLLQNINGTALVAKRMIIFNLDGNYIDFGLNWDSYANLKERFAYADWIGPALRNAGDKVLVPPRPTEWQSTGEVVFSLARRMNPHTIIEVQQPYTLLEQTITSGITPDSSASIIIHDDEGRIFYPYGLDSLPYRPEQLRADPGGTEIVHAETGRTNVLHVVRSSYTGLTIALLQPKDALLKPIRRLHVLSLIIIGAAELLALALSYLIAKTITSPILKLQRYVRKVELEHAPVLSPPASILHSVEVDELYDTFAKMTMELRGSMNQVIDLQRRESMAQLQALFAQMNPHFLYNTLSTIGRRAEESADPEVAEMCYRLTHMLRYSTVSLSRPAPLREELNHAAAYLELMKMRYEHQFRAVVAVDPGLEEEEVPRLILQPLLENCFTHGFQSVEPPWVIQLLLEREDREHWSLAVRDNGSGFDPGILSSIGSMIDGLHAGRPPELQRITTRGLGSVGLENTLTRCYLFWKERARYEVRNLGEGAEIRIRIRTGEEME